jgi:hypothetical protein
MRGEDARPPRRVSGEIIAGLEPVAATKRGSTGSSPPAPFRPCASSADRRQRARERGRRPKQEAMKESLLISTKRAATPAAPDRILPIEVSLVVQPEGRPISWPRLCLRRLYQGKLAALRQLARAVSSLQTAAPAGAAPHESDPRLWKDRSRGVRIRGSLLIGHPSVLDHAHRLHQRHPRQPRGCFPPASSTRWTTARAQLVFWATSWAMERTRAVVDIVMGAVARGRHRRGREPRPRRGAGAQRSDASRRAERRSRGRAGSSPRRSSSSWTVCR